MEIGETKSAALKTALSFHFQCLVGLERCLSLEDGQSIWFERDGDVSQLGTDSDSSVQVEVKNYSDYLTDSHENLWKTLKNWLSPEFHADRYSDLVLHTTQAFGKKSILNGWNRLSGDEKLNVVLSIAESNLGGSDISKIQQEVVNTEKSKLLDVLAKTSLYTEVDDVETLFQKLKNKLIGIPPNNRTLYIEGLIGFVYAESNSHSWVIKYRSFNSRCEELTKRYSKSVFTFPEFHNYEATDMDIHNQREQLFVKKINEIQFYSQLPEAVGNWIELWNTLDLELDEYPTYYDSTIKYSRKLVNQFKRKYLIAKADTTDLISDSQSFYADVIDTEPMSINGYPPPTEYKNGLLHDAMNDQKLDLKWRLED